MDRRNFLRTLVGGVAGAAAVRTWPFRVYSFPSEISVYPADWADKYITSKWAPPVGGVALTPEMLRRAVSVLRNETGEPRELIIHPAQCEAYLSF